MKQIRIVKTFASPAKGPGGLAWNGKALWHAGNDEVFRLSSETGEVLTTLKGPTVNYSGIEFAKGSLWLGGWLTGEIYRLDPKTDRVSLAVQTEAGPHAVVGLAWDGLYLWQGNCKEQKLYRHDSESGKVLDVFLVGTDIAGMTYDGQHLWYLDYEGRTLRQFDPKVGRILSSYPMEGDPCGLTWDGETFWIAQFSAREIQKIALARS